MTTDAPRMDAMEAKLAFQEDTLSQLSDALVAQQARIDRLEARLELLAEQVVSQAEQGGGGSQPPPHY